MTPRCRSWQRARPGRAGRPSVCRPRSAGGGFFYSPDRGGAHPEQHLAGYAGLMQADAYAGFGRLYEANRKGGPSSRPRAGRTAGASSLISRAQQGADRGRGGKAHRCSVRYRARDQRFYCAGAFACAPGA
ncbi:transposase [Bradyrhizobium sp. CB2312]|uniref:IS66 family transposase n=1 Tax=Bradyrhizobium sp. CB2312 TaxID=3039155 RepID=UPI0024B22DC2|nr:transposase [Bradyrhizobium sp. CB2312]WFU77156.1 transposase [Bradyrhizobium sp. CB2312]